MIFLSFSEIINKIALATANATWAASKNSIKVKICQKQECCETPIFPGEYKVASISTFSGTDLGECKHESINKLVPIEATVISPSSTDGWLGTSITILSVSGQLAVCPITTWIDNDNDRHPNTLKIDCSVKGKVVGRKKTLTD